MPLGNEQTPMTTYPAFNKKSRQVSGTTDMSIDDCVIEFTETGTLNLIPISQFQNRFVIVKNSTVADTVTLDGNGSENIDGNLFELIDVGVCVILTPRDASSWMIVSKYTP